MPLLLEKDGYQFYFKKGEPLIPYKNPHVHVRGHGGKVEFYLLDITIKKDNKSISRSKITEIKKIVQENSQNFLNEWNKIKSKK